MSIAEALQTALVHTLLGMGTVFAVLILISLIISLFKYIPMIQEKFSKKPQASEALTAQEEPVQMSVPQEEEKEEDDLEVVAVITAAIAAALGTQTTDGFIVRSIKRRRNSHWK